LYTHTCAQTSDPDITIEVRAEQQQQQQQSSHSQTIQGGQHGSEGAATFRRLGAAGPEEDGVHRVKVSLEI